jgi:hypothetical protein
MSLGTVAVQGRVLFKETNNPQHLPRMKTMCTLAALLVALWSIQTSRLLQALSNLPRPGLRSSNPDDIGRPLRKSGKRCRNGNPPFIIPVYI